MTESQVQALILRALGSRPDTRLFRNQVGGAWMGKPSGGVLRLEDARFVQCGLAVGSGDLIGWHSVTVTPEMVGRKLAVFLSVEVKTETGRVRPEQVNWLEQVRKHGGIAVVARNVEEAQKGLAPVCALV
jgi:hypothetical protein